MVVAGCSTARTNARIENGVQATMSLSAAVAPQGGPGSLPMMEASFGLGDSRGDRPGWAWRIKTHLLIVPTAFDVYFELPRTGPVEHGVGVELGPVAAVYAITSTRLGSEGYASVALKGTAAFWPDVGPSSSRPDATELPILGTLQLAIGHGAKGIDIAAFASYTRSSVWFDINFLDGISLPGAGCKDSSGCHEKALRRDFVLFGVELRF
jgi:hypothetical protein